FLMVSPNLGVQLRNVATINDLGEMAAVAFFPDGSHRPVLLVPCGVKSGENEDCQGSENLNVTASVQGNSTLSLAPSIQNNRTPTSLPIAFRALLARRRSRTP